YKVPRQQEGPFVRAEKNAPRSAASKSSATKTPSADGTKPAAARTKAATIRTVDKSTDKSIKPAPAAAPRAARKTDAQPAAAVFL
ncbi:hypothetical protein ACSNOK_35165, partial [Streptomyces sp. URMC 126]